MCTIPFFVKKAPRIVEARFSELDIEVMTQTTTKLMCKAWGLGKKG